MIRLLHWPNLKTTVDEDTHSLTIGVCVLPEN